MSELKTDLPPVDLRSDTVTRPTPPMRRAMAEAEVGDDVYGEDPTINQLEKEAAATFGKEAALFVPTGSMGNQIGIRLHTQHGQEVICEARAHIVDWEMGMVAAFSGCHLRTIPARHGILTWQHIRTAIAPPIYYRAQTGLISLENSHNMAGGTVTPLSVFEEIWREADKLNLPVHLDGARVFNAATALGISVAALTRGFRTVNFCLSKGLCAPVGSVLVGSSADIARARSFRKALGGGMRQAGILAAAGLIALETMSLRLGEDHANASFLAKSMARIPGVEIDLETVQTNIILFRVTGRQDAAGLVTRLKSRGVLAGTTDAATVRFVTHHDVDRAGCERALTAVDEVVRETSA